MSFIETPRFPDLISMGASGGPVYNTDVVQVDSGFEQRNARWDQARARYTFEMPLVDADRELVIAFFRSMKGRAHGFRLKDWSDYQCTMTTGLLGTSTNATGDITYQLTKYYAQGLVEYRAIKKPVVNAVQLYRGGVLTSTGFTIDYTTGLVTFAFDQSRNITGITVGTSTVITLASAIAGLAIGGKLYVIGVAGTVGNVLNNRPHTITNIAASVYTVSTNTAGLVYGGSGTARTYPQPSETLAWVGEFDVPVRFDADQLTMTKDASRVYHAQSVSLIEIRV